MDILNAVWQYVVPIFGSLSFAGIFSAIIYGVLKGAFSRTISKINVEKIADEATEKGIKKVKEVSFKHSIQPLVESELNKINEKAVEVVEKTLGEVQAKYDNLIAILEKFSAYFDNSIGVPLETREELKKTIQAAKTEPKMTESEAVVEFVEEKPKQAVEQVKTKQKAKLVR